VAVPTTGAGVTVLQASLVPAIGSNWALVAGSPVAVTSWAAGEPKANKPLLSCR
jgi:hypothetical protein